MKQLGRFYNKVKSDGTDQARVPWPVAHNIARVLNPARLAYNFFTEGGFEVFSDTGARLVVFREIYDDFEGKRP